MRMVKLLPMATVLTVMSIRLWGGDGALAQAIPESITLCHEDADAYPWLMKDKPGYSIFQIQEVAKQLAVPIKLVARSWKQCLDDVKSGAVDGAINGSYSKDRAAFAAYPYKLDGQADAGRRMYRATYALYKAKGSNVTFDGTKVSGITGPIGAQTGFSIIAQIKQLGAKVDDSMSKSTDLLQAVVAGKLQAVALQTSEADGVIADDAVLKTKIERVATPLTEKPYFTIFNQAFFDKYGQTSRQLWQTERKVRDSAEFRDKVAHLVKNVD